MSLSIFLLFITLLISLAILSLYLINRIEDIQGLANARTKALLNAEMRIEHGEKLLAYQESKIKNLEEKVNKYEEYITSNNYSNAETRLNKLKELVTDYQSANQF